MDALRAAAASAVSNTVMRAPGEATGTFALEPAVDDLAAVLGLDPIELQILNASLTGPLQAKAFANATRPDPGHRSRRSGQRVMLPSLPNLPRIPPN
jgi:CO/xanthine dehydrogenase Mo-binding subunit